VRGASAPSTARSQVLPFDVDEARWDLRMGGDTLSQSQAIGPLLADVEALEFALTPWFTTPEGGQVSARYQSRSGRPGCRHSLGTQYGR
jgi:hypothetical protein